MAVDLPELRARWRELTADPQAMIGTAGGRHRLERLIDDVEDALIERDELDAPQENYIEFLRQLLLVAGERWP